ncbi:thiol-activated cytolysin family protein [Deinococcus hohokamensis]|uniref:Thiol-activated cytolysin family protein n=1 Tax=Deinococcus hohokamensis TaxID=309883 RepID=A0ABV9I5G8_9DEIO
MTSPVSFRLLGALLLPCLTGQSAAQVRPLPVQPTVPRPVLTVPLLPLTPGQIEQLSPAQLMSALSQYKIVFTQIPRTPRIPLLLPPLTKVGAPTQTLQDTPDGQVKCSVQRYRLSAAPPEYAMKTLDQDKLWVGSLVRTAGLELGSMEAVGVPESRRQSYRITSALPTTAGSATIAPNQTAYNLAVAAVRQGLVGNPFGSTIRYEITEQSSAETSALKLGLKAGGIGYSVKAAGSLSNENRQNRVSAAFVQNAFTMNADLGGRTPAEAFLSGPDPADLTALTDPARPAAYIDSITYGRLLFVEMTSSYTSQQMKAALDASYSGVSASVQAEAQKVLSSSRFNVYAAGGNEQGIVDLIRTQKLAQYFQNSSDPRTLVPISFTARNFVGGSYAASATTGEFAESVCNPNSVKVSVRLSYRSIEPEDSRYDDVFGEMALGGTEVWRLGSGQRVDLYKGQTLNLNGLPGLLTLNYGEPRNLSLTGRLMDWDAASPNDVIGVWSENIDLAAVAEELRAGAVVVRREYRRRGSDDADGVLIVEFSRSN